MAEARAKKDATGDGSAGGRPAAKRAAPKPEETVPAEAKREGVCPVAFCPIGMALTTVQQAGPEVIEHLLAAAREFLLAAKAAIDARADGLGEPKGDSQLERIEIG